ncbi:MAG: hypothetical protein Q7U04_08685 [Bacteriovorax sp.]|nr:hypothetical protein [Bacteriovorax sp.]
MVIQVKYFFLFLMLFLFTSNIFGEENPNLEKVVNEIIQITKQVSNTGTPLIKSCGEFKETAQTDFSECSEAIELNKSIQLNFKRDRNKNQGKLFDLLETCFQKKFDKCYPNLNETIGLNKLKSLFDDWKKDSRFRYATGFGMCAYRAEALSYHLAEMGYKTKTIKIKNSPTLIAMDRDINGKLNGTYDEYRGNHVLVQIMVNRDGEDFPYLLDPQYMDEAKPLEEYFIETTGQVCKKIKEDSQKSPIDLTNCYYSEDSQNSTADPASMHLLFNKFKTKLDEEMLTCGWSDKDIKLGHSIAPKWSQIDKKDTKIISGNSATPEFFKGKDVSLTTSRELILFTYENYADELNKKLDFANKQIEISSQFPLLTPQDFQEEMKNEKANAIYSLNQLKSKIKIIKDNLKKSAQD